MNKQFESDPGETPTRPLAPARVRPQEALLIRILDHLPGDRLVANTVGRGQFASAFAEARPSGHASVCFWDHFAFVNAQRTESPTNLSFHCQPDFPNDEVDVAAIVCSVNGEAEFTRDLMQQGMERLVVGGRLAVAVDNPDDKWVHEAILKLSSKVSRRASKRATVYWAMKTDAAFKRKNFDAEFAFRDSGHLVWAYSRPSVFSHRKLDLGARALLEAIELRPGWRVLDLGCGSGVLALAAAMRGSATSVLAVDSNPRAVECVLRGAERNGVSDRVTALLDSDGSGIPTRYFDAALANPPYFSRNRISESFLRSMHRSVKPGGLIAVVTKQPEWFQGRFPQVFANVKHKSGRGYTIIYGRRR
jgi:16S rRNA (guanine1207-N2)-methyltransferase